MHDLKNLWLARASGSTFHSSWALSHLQATRIADRPELVRAARLRVSSALHGRQYAEGHDGARTDDLWQLADRLLVSDVV